jgi:hypothetical protein
MSYKLGESQIPTSFAESAINEVVSKWMVKKTTDVLDEGGISSPVAGACQDTQR